MSEALHAVLAELTPEQAGNFTKAVHAIAAAAQKQYGVLPTVEEVMGTAMVKAATYDPDGTFDMDNALFQLRASATVAAHVAAKEAEARGESPAMPQGATFATSGVVTAADLDAIPRHLRPYVKEGQTVEDINALTPNSRMAIIRALTLPTGVRHPTLPDMRDREVARWADGLDDTDLSPADRMSRARRGAK